MSKLVYKKKNISSVPKQTFYDSFDGEVEDSVNAAYIDGGKGLLESIRKGWNYGRKYELTLQGLKHGYDSAVEELNDLTDGPGSELLSPEKAKTEYGVDTEEPLTRMRLQRMSDHKAEVARIEAEWQQTPSLAEAPIPALGAILGMVAGVAADPLFIFGGPKLAQGAKAAVQAGKSSKAAAAAAARLHNIRAGEKVVDATQVGAAMQKASKASGAYGVSLGELSAAEGVVGVAHSGLTHQLHKAKGHEYELGPEPLLAALSPAVFLYGAHTLGKLFNTPAPKTRPQFDPERKVTIEKPYDYKPMEKLLNAGKSVSDNLPVARGNRAVAQTEKTLATNDVWGEWSKVKQHFMRHLWEQLHKQTLDVSVVRGERTLPGGKNWDFFHEFVEPGIHHPQKHYATPRPLLKANQLDEIEMILDSVEKRLFEIDPSVEIAHALDKIERKLKKLAVPKKAREKAVKPMKEGVKKLKQLKKTRAKSKQQVKKLVGEENPKLTPRQVDKLSQRLDDTNMPKPEKPKAVEVMDAVGPAPKTIKLKKEEQAAEFERMKAEFLAKGGKVKKVPTVGRHTLDDSVRSTAEGGGPVQSAVLESTPSVKEGTKHLVTVRHVGEKETFKVPAGFVKRLAAYEKEFPDFPKLELAEGKTELVERLASKERAYQVMEDSLDDEMAKAMVQGKKETVKATKAKLKAHIKTQHVEPENMTLPDLLAEQAKHTKDPYALRELAKKAGAGKKEIDGLGAIGYAHSIYGDKFLKDMAAVNSVANDLGADLDFFDFFPHFASEAKLKRKIQSIRKYRDKHPMVAAMRDELDDVLALPKKYKAQLFKEPPEVKPKANRNLQTPENSKSAAKKTIERNKASANKKVQKAANLPEKMKAAKKMYDTCMLGEKKDGNK